MVSEAHYEAALNYFYFLLMDEGASLQCALRTFKAFQKKSKQAKLDKKDPDQLLIEVMSEVLHRHRSKKMNPSGDPPKSEWKTPDKDLLASWKDYLRSGDLDSAETLVLRFILGYPAKLISKALSVPEGTIFFRLGRGLGAFSGTKS